MARRLSLPPETVSTLEKWYSRDLLLQTRFVGGSLWGRLFGASGQAAVTINRTVHLTPRAPDLDTRAGLLLAAHELYHVVQQREMGWWRFFLRYLWRWRPSHLRNGRSHPLEAPAYARAEEVRRVLEG